MKAFLLRISFLLAATFLSPLQANTIAWFCNPNRVNHTSTGANMDAAFQFQLGVFTGTFIPTISNMSEWSSRWQSAQVSSYNTATKSFGNAFTVSANPAPFTVGKKAYIWGRKTTATASEWILFSAISWTWPAPDPMNPFTIDWNTAAADLVLAGSIDPTVASFLMKSQAVFSYTQWQDSQLVGEILSSPNDDPDHDGTSNLLEFVFGTSPTQPTVPTLTTMTLVEISGQKYLQMSVPRLRNRLAAVTVEVSENLVNWLSGTNHLVEVTNTSELLIVRDLTPSSSGQPRRFLRVKAVNSP